MESTVLTEPSAPETSTVIEPRVNDENPSAIAHKEQEKPEVKEEQRKPESRIDTIKRAAADLEKANAKPEDKPVEKPEAAKVEAQPPKAEKTEQEAEKPLKPSEGRKIIEAPARFLPRAKELWNNVPHEVRAEYQRIDQEREQEITQYREAKAFRDGLKDFEDMARSKGVDFKQALTNYVDIERKFSEDPAQGFRVLLQNTNMTPQQAIGHVLRAFGATPAQLVQHIQAAPHEYTGLAQRATMPQVQQQAQPQSNPEIMDLKAQLSAMQAQQVAQSVIAPFANEYPDYYQHEDQIAKVLESGIIEQIHGNGLSPRDKLEAALFMVAPHVKRTTQPAQNSVQQVAVEETPAVDLRGKQSIKGAPTPGTDSSTRKRGSMSRTEAIQAAMSELGIRL